MRISLNAKPETVTRMVPGTDIILTAQRPSFEQRLREFVGDDASSWIRNRLTSIVGWSGVVDDNDTPVTFSPEAFKCASEQVPGFYECAIEFVMGLYRERVDPKKSSDSSLSDGEATAR